MAITLVQPVNATQVAALIADGYTTWSLWVSNTPEGPYTNASITPTPATLAAAVSTSVYTFTYVYAGGNPGQYYRFVPFDGGNYGRITDSSPIHGGGGTTLAVLRQRLGLLLDDMRVGAAVATTNTTSLVHAEPMLLREPDNFFLNWMVNNTTRGLWRTASASSKAGASITHAAIAGQVTGDSFEITRRFAPNQYREALNWAIAEGYPALSRPILNDGFLSGEDVYRYQVPQDMRTIDRVEISDEDSQINHPNRLGGPWREIPNDPISDGLLRYFEFKNQQPFETVARKIRIRGTGPLSQLYNDSDYTQILDPQLDLLIYRAASRLWYMKIAGAASTDRDYFKEQNAFWNAEADKARHNGKASSRQPHKIWQKTAQWAKGV